MADKVFLRLNSRWALGYDELQWMIMQWRPRKGRPNWSPVAFISDSKPALLRILREKGILVAPEATCALAHLPESFRDWYPRRQEWIAEHTPRTWMRRPEMADPLNVERPASAVTESGADFVSDDEPRMDARTTPAQGNPSDGLN